MTRAEEAALEAYPQNGDNVISQEGYRLMRSIYVDGYEAGYEQAEKDLGWHSVDKCLPELNTEVIGLWFDYGEVRAVPTKQIGITMLIQPIQCVPTGEKVWTIPGIKYWMPMPEIPKEK